MGASIVSDWTRSEVTEDDILDSTTAIMQPLSTLENKKTTPSKAGSGIIPIVRGYGYESYGIHYNYSNYGNYGNYGNYCNTCQVCNTCQALCQVGSQVISSYIGTYSKSLNKILTTDLNDLIDYIISAGDYGKVTTGLSTSNKVAVSNIVNKDSFNIVNTAINTFTDTSTGLSAKVSGNKANAADMNTLRDTINAAKMPPKAVACCQKSGYQTCIDRML